MASKYGEMREMLLQAIEDCRTGKMDPHQASAIAKLASAVNASIQVEINAAKELLLINPKLAAKVAKGDEAIQLGSMSLGDEISTVDD